MDLEFDVLDCAGPPKATVIWLHGIGQDAPTLVPLAQRLGLPQAAVRSVFPRAPRLATPMAGGAPARVWFDQDVFSLEHADMSTLHAAETRLRELVAAESMAVGSSRVLLAGFSQGAALALITGLRYPQPLGGLALYAPFVPAELPLRQTRSPANLDIPIWIGHGREDWVVPVIAGIRVHLTLRRWGHDVSWHSYPGDHEPFAGAADDLGFFLEAAASGRPAS